MKQKDQAPALKQMYTVQEAAALFHVCRMTVIRWIEAGQIEAVKIGGHWRITEREIRRANERRGR